MKRLTIFRDTLKDIMNQTDEETRDRPNVKQKDIMSSFVPQHEESSVNVRVPSGIRNKGSGSLKRFKSKRGQAISRMGKRARVPGKMASASSTYKHQKDEKAIEILEKSFPEEKKDDMIMRNSIGMLNGLLIADIRSNIANLSDLLDDTGEGAEMTKDYMVSQLMMNEEMHGGTEDLLKVPIDKMKKKRDGVDEIKKF
ncbi:hypothetical protein E3N88_15712 [Mikania micrantha]|uniref:Uncharacterized protein n=1 Tax=Mikania micrantha TaxID=192012 RepID=A0A5N6NWS4_9ASTR|nr:hypothetical protein E3N88_15712 [Mikania micrantha]